MDISALISMVQERAREHKRQKSIDTPFSAMVSSEGFDHATGVLSRTSEAAKTLMLQPWGAFSMLAGERLAICLSEGSLF
jgi:hypothetical protein